VRTLDVIGQRQTALVTRIEGNLLRPRQPRPTTAEDLHRLAALAHARGLRLTQERETVWFCSSASTPGDAHYVTGLSCDCRGFQEHQRCSHYALLHEHLGWLPDVEREAAPAPEPAPDSCLWCSGSGRIANDELRQYDACAACGGTGQRSAQPAALAA
jgi:hypothetical protein